MNWRVKGLIQKGLSFAPGGKSLNDILQRSCGGLRNFESNIAAGVSNCTNSLLYLREVGFSVTGMVIVEIGTGWYPALPLCLSVAGARVIKTYDIIRHLSEDLTLRALTALARHLPAVAEAARIPVEEAKSRYERLAKAASVRELLSLAGIDYHAPADARATPETPGSVDLVYSNSVLEHVPRDIIRGMMVESQRILRPSGLALHNIGCNDHYAFRDRSISFVNFLRYTDSQWRMWNNSLQYQNRMRAPEFEQLAREAGLEVIFRKTTVRPGSREALETFTVAPDFRRFSKDELAITSLDFISRKPVTGV